VSLLAPLETVRLRILSTVHPHVRGDDKIKVNFTDSYHLISRFEGGCVVAGGLFGVVGG